MGADTKFGGWFELQAAYSSDCSVVLPLRPSARAAPPLGPRLFNERLRAWERVRVLRVSMGADRKAKTREPIRAPSGLLQRRQRRVTLEALRKSSSSFRTEFVIGKTASMRERGRMLSSVNGR